MSILTKNQLNTVIEHDKYIKSNHTYITTNCKIIH